MTTWVVMASGPSMCQEDADYCRDRVDGAIVVNTTFRMAPWADIVYSNDHDWYEAHIVELLETVKGELVCGHPQWRHPSVTSMPFDRDAPGIKETGLAWGMNSGGAALNLAYLMGAKRIIMLGYDQQWKGDKARWHGAHPQGLQNQRPGFHRWAKWFAQASIDLESRGVQVFNCSRETSLGCFQRAELRKVLC